MKTRENELHEPIIERARFRVGYYEVVKCSIRKKQFGNIGSDCMPLSDYQKRFLLTTAPNYCPHCGARLKEVGV